MKIRMKLTNLMINFGQWLIATGCKLADKNKKQAAFGEF